MAEYTNEKNGVIKQYVGGYSDYAESVARQNIESSGQGKVTESKETKTEKLKDRVRKFTFKEQKEYDEIDGIIASVEGELKVVGNRINQCGSDFTLLQELTEIQQKLEEQLEQLLERWTYLNELAEEIGKA